MVDRSPAISMLITALFGGSVVAGLVKLYRTYWTQHRKNDQQDSELGRQMRNELKMMLDGERNKREAMGKRLDAVEDRLDEERERRPQAERQNELLQRKLDLVIRLLNDMREENGMERLSEDDIALIAVNDTDSKRHRE